MDVLDAVAPWLVTLVAAGLFWQAALGWWNRW